MSINVPMTNKTGVTLATSGKYCEDNIAVAPSAAEQAKIIPANIKKGVNILGVEGTLEAGGGASLSSFDTPYLKYTCEDITIGSNSLSLGMDIYNYILDTYGDFYGLALLSNPTVANQLVLIQGQIHFGSGDQVRVAGYRYRDGALQLQPMYNNNYAFKIVEGTKYRLWKAVTDVTKATPY